MPAEIIIGFAGDTLSNFLAAIQTPRRVGVVDYFRIAVDEGQLKLKFNEEVWSPNLGSVEFTSVK